jgi:predicted phage tail protein
MDPATAIAAATPFVKPALNGLARVIEAIKAPFSKKQLEELRTQLADGLNEVLIAVQRQSEEIDRLNAELASMQTRITYVELPFWKKWFSPKPK